MGVNTRKYEKHCKAQFVGSVSIHFCDCSSNPAVVILHISYIFFFLLHVINLLVKEEKKRFLSTLIVIQNLSTVTQMNYHELYL